MAGEQRRNERRDFTYYMKMTDANTGAHLGYIVDISTSGFKLDSEKPLPVGRDFRVQLELSGEISPKSTMIFTARSMWCMPDTIYPNTFRIGFQVVGMAPGDTIIYHRMYEQYGSTKNNYNSTFGYTHG